MAEALKVIADNWCAFLGLIAVTGLALAINIAEWRGCRCQRLGRCKLDIDEVEE